MTKSEAITAIEDYMDASLGVNAEITEKAKEAINVLKADGWIPVEEQLPEVDEDGMSDDILLSFANATFLCIGIYDPVRDTRGAFYDGDDDDKPLEKIGLIVNAWQPLPEPYQGGKR